LDGIGWNLIELDGI